MIENENLENEIVLKSKYLKKKKSFMKLYEKQISYKNETNNSLKEKLELNKLTCKRRRSRSAFSTLAFSNAFTGENDLTSPNFIKTLREIRDGLSELQRFIRNVPKLNGNY